MLLLLLGAAIIVGLAARGSFGPLVVCGVDGWAVCVGWPRLVSALVWLLFLGFVVLLGGWHVREWRAAARGEPTAGAGLASASPSPSTAIATRQPPALHADRVE